jgi:hypothetical protein
VVWCERGYERETRRTALRNPQSDGLVFQIC